MTFKQKLYEVMDSELTQCRGTPFAVSPESSFLSSFSDSFFFLHPFFLFPTVIFHRVQPSSLLHAIREMELVNGRDGTMKIFVFWRFVMPQYRGGCGVGWGGRLGGGGAPPPPPPPCSAQCWSSIAMETQSFVFKFDNKALFGFLFYPQRLQMHDPLPSNYKTAKT